MYNALIAELTHKYHLNQMVRDQFTAKTAIENADQPDKKDIKIFQSYSCILIYKILLNKQGIFLV
jgi:hypothetical protein